MILRASEDGFVDCGCVTSISLRKPRVYQKPGLYVVGECDRVLPSAMAKFAPKPFRKPHSLELRELVILPMVEQSEAFVKVIRDFLGSS
jgi:pimeloyl-ACP methyl ester carboxylesterase